MTKDAQAPKPAPLGAEQAAAEAARAPQGGHSPGLPKFLTTRGPQAGMAGPVPPAPAASPAGSATPQAQATGPGAAPTPPAAPAAPKPAPAAAPAPGAAPQPPKPAAQAPQQPAQQKKPGPNQNKQPGQWKKNQQNPQQNPMQAPAVQVRPLAEPAKMRTRHWRLMMSFAALVLLPLVLIVAYLSILAQDQYGSITGFTVRQEEGGGASEILGGLTQIVGGSGTGSDSDILYEYIQSQELVDTVQQRLDIRAHYAQNWPTDFAFAVWPDASAEDMLWFWQRIVRISLDSSSGLIEVRVLAYDPQMAQDIAREIVRESQDKINALNEQARADAMRYAEDDLAAAVTRLKDAREALTRFRSRTQIVDPAADLEGRMGVMGALQEQLAAARIEYGLLQETTSATDPRIQQALRRIEVIEKQIADERDRFANPDTTDAEDAYPELIAEFESLSVDREFAEQTYTAALAALDLARNNAARQSRYLATYIEPTRAQTSEYPGRFGIAAMAAFFLLLSWAIMALIYYSLRDRN